MNSNRTQDQYQPVSAMSLRGAIVVSCLACLGLLAVGSAGAGDIVDGVQLRHLATITVTASRSAGLAQIAREQRALPMVRLATVTVTASRGADQQLAQTSGGQHRTLSLVAKN